MWLKKLKSLSIQVLLYYCFQQVCKYKSIDLFKGGELTSLHEFGVLADVVWTNVSKKSDVLITMVTSDIFM